MSNANPFNNMAPSAPSVPSAPVPGNKPVSAPAAPAAAPTAAANSEKKARKSPNRQMTSQERQYVLENYSVKNTAEIAQELNLTRQQVYRTVNESRKNLQSRLEALQSQPDSPEKKAQIDKINGLLNKLPAKPFGGGAGAGGKRKSSIDSVLDTLLG